MNDQEILKSITNTCAKAINDALLHGNGSHALQEVMQIIDDAVAASPDYISSEQQEKIVAHILQEHHLL